MSQSYEIQEAPPDDEVPGVEYELERAKLYLQKYCPAAGDNLYDHLSEVLNKILTEQPADVFGAFQDHSKKLIENKFRPKNDCLREAYVSPCQYEHAAKLVELFKANSNLEDEQQQGEGEGEDGEEEVEGAGVEQRVYPNLFDDMFYFEQCGIGLPRLLLVRLNLSVRRLIARTRIENARFWGKILGRRSNYYVVEANLPHWEIERRLSSGDEDERKSEGDSGKSEKGVVRKSAFSVGEGAEEEEEQDVREIEAEGLKLVFPPLPENTWKEEPQVDPEKLGTGANAKVYFVCNSPGTEDWVELPDVTPQQIVVARQILHTFTGNLEAEIHSYPPFPGSEKNYLRAQIARISAATLVSPIGFFSFGGAAARSEGDEEEEDEDDEEEEEAEYETPDGGGELVANRKYQPLSLKELTDPSLSAWCHHCPALLEQGRVVWQDPSKTGTPDQPDEDEDEGEDEEDEEEEEESREESEVGREIPPALLAPLSEDSGPNRVKPWTARQSSRIQPDTAVAYVRSNLWPGAFAYARDKSCANIYIGWGHKHNAYNHNPASMPAVEDQFAGDSEIVEIQDPSFEEEEAYRIAHLPPSDDGNAGEEEESSEEESDQE